MQKLFIVDHGHTLLMSGDLPTLRSATFADPQRILALCPDLAAAIKNVNELAGGLERLASLPEQQIGEWIDSSPLEWVPEPSLLQPLKDFLLERREKLKGILESHLDRFPNLQRGAP